MNTATALYYNGPSVEPVEVTVLLFDSAIHLYETGNNHPIDRFPLKQAVYKNTSTNHLVYLDETGNRYLQFPNDHPLATTLAREIAEATMSTPKRLLKNRALVILSFILLVLIGFYFLLISLIPYLGTKMIGAGQEIALGEQLHAAMMQQAKLLGEVQDTTGSLRLQGFADELRLSDRYPVRITLLKSNTINAFALPGGNIVVYTGLLQKIKTPEALAALLAHECTHVNQRHSLRSMLRSVASTLAIAVIFGDASGIAAALANNVEALNGLRYSRSLEQEADRRGMELLIENGVDAKGMQQLLQTLQKAGGDIPDEFSFLSSHPLTKERLKEAERYVQEHPQKISEREELRILFERLK